MVLRIFAVQYKYIPTFRTNMLTLFFLFCTITNKCTIISQIIIHLHVSTLSCHFQGACNQYLAKLLVIVQNNIRCIVQRVEIKKCTFQDLMFFLTVHHELTIY